jgi:hypothetical protein
MHGISHIKIEMQKFMCSDTANVEHEMYDYTGKAGATRIVKKGTKKNLEAIPGIYSIDSLQKTAVL